MEKAAEDPVVGSVFSERYRIDRVLGDGGMGRVYVATQLSMNREVALKTLHQQLLSDRRYVGRFYQEAKAASQLNSPHVVRMYDFGIDEETGTPYIAMELLQGTPLDGVIEQEGTLPSHRAAGILSQVGKALMDAHQHGIVHRDLKPENIFMVRTADEEDFSKVMDFGIAKLLQTESDSKLTATGTTLGTPLYMSPEQITGGELSFRSDLYALGCILHELLTGTPPFNAEERLPILLMHVQDEPPALPDSLPTGERCHPELQELYLSLMAKQSEDRPGSTGEVVRALSRIARTTAVYTPAQGAEVAGAAAAPAPAPSEELETAPAAAPPAPAPTPAEADAGATELGEQVQAPPPRVAVTSEADISEIRPGGNRWLPIALGAAALIILVVAGYLVMKPTDTETKAQETKPAPVAKTTKAPEPKAPEPAVTPKPAETAKAPEVKPPEPKEPPKPPEVEFKFQTEPAGAAVFRGDEKLGTTPFTWTGLKAGDALEFRLELSGFKTQTTSLVPDRDREVVISLEKKRRTKRITRPARPSGSKRDRKVDKDKMNKLLDD